MQVSDDALAAGAVPDPIGDPTAGWMYNEAVQLDEPTLVNTHFERDIRSKRRLEGDRNTIMFALEMNTGNLVWSMGIRLLYIKK